MKNMERGGVDTEQFGNVQESERYVMHLSGTKNYQWGVQFICAIWVLMQFGPKSGEGSSYTPFKLPKLWIQPPRIYFAQGRIHCTPIGIFLYTSLAGFGPK